MMWSKQFNELCVAKNRWPVAQPLVKPRSNTISEELEKLREDYKAFPDKRWHITQRATMLKSALAKLQGCPLPSKQLQDDEEFVQATEQALL